MNVNISKNPTSKTQMVNYKYLITHHHSVLRLKYLDKYMVQFSDINAGSLGGKHTRIDFIGGEKLTQEELNTFINDILRFHVNNNSNSDNK